MGNEFIIENIRGIVIVEKFVSFQEVSSLLYDSIWVDSFEIYWYQYAWSILVKSNITVYKNEFEHHRVYIYALVLKETYNRFCQETFDVYNDADLYDIIDGTLNELQIGQIVKPYLQDGECIDDVEEALHILVDKNTRSVYRALNSVLSESEIFAYMFSVNQRFVKNQYDWDCNEDIESEYYVTTVEDYIKMVDENLDDILNVVDGGKLNGFDYVTSLL